MPETIEQMMEDFASAAVEIARELNVSLDFSEESLESLETILGRLHAELHGYRRGTATQQNSEIPASDLDEQTIEMCKLWGGYLGEVVRRRWGGEWAMETYPGAQFATLTLNVRGGKLFPSMKVYRRLTNGAADNVWTFYQSVREKLEQTPGTKVQ